MRRLLAFALLGLTVGCHGLRRCSPGPCPMPTCTPFCQGAPSCPAPPPAPQQAPKPAPQQVAPQAVERREERAAAIAQEVLLVPRTVYVPYVAQTPVAPVRLSALTAAGATVVTEQRGPEPAPQPQRAPQPETTPPPCASTADLAELLARLNCRLERLEAQLQPVCPPAGCLPRGVPLPPLRDTPCDSLDDPPRGGASGPPL